MRPSSRATSRPSQAGCTTSSGSGKALVRGLLVEVAEYPEDAGKVAERMRLVARAGLFMVGPDELGFMDAFAPEDGSAVHIGGVSMSSVLAQGVKRGTR